MTAIAIFVKTPGFSPLKTRLAESIGQTLATDIFRSCAAAVAETAGNAAIGPVYWATAEPPEQVEENWPDLPLLGQGKGGLGARMHNVLAELVSRHGSGLLLGADAPQLNAAVLRQADEWLTRDMPARVVGPARDGGFWTFGANHVPAVERWTSVSYSRPDTLEVFRRSIGDDAEWLELPMLTDLDTEEDIPCVAHELQTLPCPLESQARIMNLLRHTKYFTLNT